MIQQRTAGRGRFAALAFALAAALTACGGQGGWEEAVVAPPPAELPLMVDSLGRLLAEADFGRGDAQAAGADGVAVDGGAPISSAEVVLGDLVGRTRTTATGPDGYYRFDVKGLTPPFVVKVHRPGGQHWFSASMAPAVVRGFVTMHLSGLSDKVLSLAAGPDGIAASATPALLAANRDALTGAKAAIRASLRVTLINAGLDPASYDPVSSPLQATAVDKHALFLKGLTITKAQGPRIDQGRTVVMATLSGPGGFAQDGASAAATFNQPASVALDRAGNLYVADTANNVIRRITPHGVVTTFSGNGVANYANADRAASAFNAPSGVAVDGAGNVYVADTGNYVVRKIMPDGSVTTLAGGGVPGHLDATGTAARFDGPISVAVDNSGNVYVGDRSIFRPASSTRESLRKVTAAGVVTTITAMPSVGAQVTFMPQALATDSEGTLHVGCGSVTVSGICRITRAGTQGMRTTPGNFIIPRGLAVDAAGTVFLVDDRAMHKLTAEGAVVTVAGGAHGNVDGQGASARFADPGGLAVDGAGNIFVADTGNDTVRKVTPAGDVSTFAGRQATGFGNGAAATATFAQPEAVAAGADGALYIADTGNNAIRKLDPSGAVTTLAAGFNAPGGVAVDGAGNVYVADSGNHVLRKITPAGTVTTHAGSGTEGHADGPGTAAKFSAPAHIALDGAGNLYVSDTGNVSIRKITPAGVVSTIAGLGRRVASQTEAEAQGFFGVGALVADRSGAVTFDATCKARLMVLNLQCLFTIPPGGERGPARIGTRNEWRRSGMAVDGAGNLYYAFLYFGKYGLEHQKKIFRLAADGTETEIASLPELTINAIAGMTMDAQGNLVFLDRNRSTVRVLLP